MQDNSQADLRGQGGAGLNLSDLARAPTHAQPVPRVDSHGEILSADALKMRGMHAAQYHKTSIDTMLHSRHAGATPYRTVLGDVSSLQLAPFAYQRVAGWAQHCHMACSCCSSVVCSC